MGLAGCGESAGLGYVGFRDSAGPDMEVVSLRESDSLPGLYYLDVQARDLFTPPVQLALSTDVGVRVRIDSLPMDPLHPSLRSFRIDFSQYSGHRAIRIEAFDGNGNRSSLSMPVRVRSRTACGDSPASAGTQFAEDANGDIWAIDGGLYKFDADSLEFLPVSLPALGSGADFNGIAADKRGLLGLALRGSVHVFDGRTMVRSAAFPAGISLDFPKIAFGADNSLLGLWRQSNPQVTGVFALSDTGLVLAPLGHDRPFGFAVDSSGLIWISSGLRLIAYEPEGFDPVDSVTPSEGVSEWPLSLDASGRIVQNSGTHRLIRADSGWVKDPFPHGEEACFDQPRGSGMWCFPGTVPSHLTFYRGGSPLMRNALDTYVPRFHVDSRGRLWTTSGRYSGYCGFSQERF